MSSFRKVLLAPALLLGCFVATAPVALAQVTAPSTTTMPSRADDPPGGTRLLRTPTVSATQIAFGYAGNIWVVARSGGDARRITSFAAEATNPQFSPDGALIAFSGQYAGNTDVYVVPSRGGEPKRLTWHPGNDQVQGWTPDGRNVVFSSG